MKAMFRGDPADDLSGPRVLRAFGRAFPKGRFITIEGPDADALVAKLSANSHFEVAEGEGEADLTPLEPEITQAEIAGEAEPAASGESKADVLAQLEVMQAKYPELEYDGRWGLAKLKAALEAAQFEHGED